MPDAAQNLFELNIGCVYFRTPISIDTLLCINLRPQCTRKEKKQGFNSGGSPIRVGLRDNYHSKLDWLVHHKTRRFLGRKSLRFFRENLATFRRFSVISALFPGNLTLTQTNNSVSPAQQPTKYGVLFYITPATSSTFPFLNSRSVRDARHHLLA